MLRAPSRSETFKIDFLRTMRRRWGQFSSTSESGATTSGRNFASALRRHSFALFSGRPGDNTQSIWVPTPATAMACWSHQTTKLKRAHDHCAWGHVEEQCACRCVQARSTDGTACAPQQFTPEPRPVPLPRHGLRRTNAIQGARSLCAACRVVHRR